MLYYLYIDDVGDEGDYKPAKIGPHGKSGSSPFFTLGGIIVHEEDRYLFSMAQSKIVQDFFTKEERGEKFKLHYEELRFRRYPYNLLGESGVKDLSDTVFLVIKNVKCSVISVTIDIQYHCERYSVPVGVRAYSLFALLERFQYFLEDNNDRGIAIYESYNSVLRKQVEKIHNQFLENPNFPKLTDFKNIEGRVRDGNAFLDHTLQFSDFFTYAPYKKCVSKGVLRCRYEEIKHKYYNLDYPYPYKRGNYEITRNVDS